jgi:hypothetical protein
LCAETLHELEAEHTGVEVERALEIGNLEMDVSNVDVGINGGTLAEVMADNMQTVLRKVKQERRSGCRLASRQTPPLFCPRGGMGPVPR